MISDQDSFTQTLTESVVGWPETVTWAKRVGLAGRTLDDEIFAELAGSFAGLDMDLYLQILQLLGEHDARDLLEEVDVPLLVVAGDHDLFTPRAAADHSDGADATFALLRSCRYCSRE